MYTIYKCNLPRRICFCCLCPCGSRADYFVLYKQLGRGSFLGDAHSPLSTVEKTACSSLFRGPTL